MSDPEFHDFLQSRGADPSILTEDYDAYLNPGKKSPADTELSGDEKIRAKILALEKKYASVPKVIYLLQYFCYHAACLVEIMLELQFYILAQMLTYKHHHMRLLILSQAVYALWFTRVKVQV
jgi:hypothetical protein